MSTPPRRVRPAIRRPGPMFAALLVGAILLNLGQFRAIDTNGVPNFAALARGETADLVEMAYWECPWCRDRYSLHIALAVVAPGSRVVVAPSVPVDMPTPYPEYHDAAEELAARLLTFGRADQVDWLPDDWDDDDALLLVAGVDPLPHVVATGEGGEKGPPWSLAVDPSRLDSATAPEPAEFLEQVLASGGHRHSAAPPGEFVLLRWHVPRPGSDYPYQDLLLETSLLPEDVRELL